MAREIEFVFNSRKTVESVLYVISKMMGEIKQYNLLKVIFAADKYHLNKYALTVTGDLYIKMKYGTVPNALDEIIAGKNLKHYLKDMELTELPFKILADQESGNLISSAKNPDLDYLSPTETKALDMGIKEYGHLSFEATKNKNHQEKCWQNTADNQVIAFELMIENKKILDGLLENPYGIVV